MGANELPKFLLASTKAPDELTQCQGDSEQREPPRLGILHLLVLTACVAFYMGIISTLRLAFSDSPSEQPLGGYWAASGILHGLGGGAAIAGLLLFPARRWRGFSFPTHPGEYLLAMTGIGVVIRMVVFFWLIPLNSLVVQKWAILVPIQLLYLGIAALVFLWVLIRVKAPRWRLFLLTIPASHILLFVLVFSGFRSAHPWDIAAYGLPLLTLVVVTLWDHREGKRYPWTHWFGVGTRVWFDAAIMGMSLWWALYGVTPP